MRRPMQGTVPRKIRRRPRLCRLWSDSKSLSSLFISRGSTDRALAISQTVLRLDFELAKSGLDPAKATYWEELEMRMRAELPWRFAKTDPWPAEPSYRSLQETYEGLARAEAFKQRALALAATRAQQIQQQNDTAMLRLGAAMLRPTNGGSFGESLTNGFGAAAGLPPPVQQVPAAPSSATCPTGSFPTVDNWGNAICRRIGTGTTATAQPNPATGCPNGSFPSVDGMENNVCKSFNAGPTYYDTSHGCPNGMAPSIDKWGNNTCRPM